MSVANELAPTAGMSDSYLLVVGLSDMANKDKPSPPRNWNAVAAWFRNGGPMKHKTTPRGGACNESRDLIDQSREELQEEEADAYKMVDCNGPRCADRRIHHERPDTPRGIQRIQVPKDHTGLAFCSIECKMYWEGCEREKEGGPNGQND